MAFAAKDVMRRAATTLQDLDAVRWPASELLDYLNDGIREIVTLKPNAKTTTTTINLSEGTLQTLPAQFTVLSRAVRNIAAAGQGGAAIRPLPNRALMDSQIPGWQDSTVLPFAKTVVHVIHDMADPRSFYVVPGNDGTGVIEVVVGETPDQVPVPSSDPQLIDSHTSNVDLPDLYQNMLADYVLYRCYSKDSRLAGSAARAQAHFELFRGTLTAMDGAERGISLATAANPQPAG